MGRRSKVDALPAEVREELDSRLIGSGFADYNALAVWLSEQGYDISRSSLHRHGAALEAEFEEALSDARRTRALARAAREDGGEDGALLGAATEIMQDSLLRVSLKIKALEDDPQATAKTLSLVSRAFADVGRLDIARQKWQMEVRAKAESAAAAVEKIALKGGLTQETATTMRREILGIAA